MDTACIYMAIALIAAVVKQIDAPAKRRFYHSNHAKDMESQRFLQETLE